MAKKLFNPTDKEVSMAFKGDEYRLGPKEIKSFPNEVVDRWLGIHQFLVESEIEPPKAEEVAKALGVEEAEAPEESVEEKGEEEDLESMKYGELYELAKERGLQLPPRLKKVDIIKELKK